MSPSSQNDSNYNRASSPSDQDSLLKPETWYKKRYSFASNRRPSPDPDTSSSRDSSRKSCSSNRRGSFLLSLKSVLSWKDHGLLSPPASPKTKHNSESRPPPMQAVTGHIKPLPPLPIVDSEAIIPERTDYVGTSFRTVHGRKYHICTGKLGYNVQTPTIQNVHSFCLDHVYPLPIDDDEIDRMQMQHYVLKELFEDNLFHAPVEDKLRQGVHVLDLGCGCGSWCMEMATQYPSSTFVGLDVAPIYPTSIIPSNCSFQSCDVTNGLPFVNESFDLVISRDMALSIRYDDWKQYIEEMTRVARKDGYIELMEMDWDVKRKGEHMQDWNDTLLWRLRERGINPRIARLLKEYMEPHIQDAYVTYTSMPMGPWGGKVGTSYLTMWKALMMAFMPFYTSRTGQSKEEYGSLVDASLEDIDVTQSYSNFWVCHGQKR